MRLPAAAGSGGMYHSPAVAGSGGVQYTPAVLKRFMKQIGMQVGNRHTGR